MGGLASSSRIIRRADGVSPPPARFCSARGPAGASSAMPLDNFEISWKPGVDPSYLRQREWLVANGLGGYASGTVAGGVSRRFHGVFVPKLPAPRGRTMTLP